MDRREEQQHPTTNQPLHGEPRPRYWPILVVVGVLGVVAAVFLLLTYLQQHT